jgi:hypothetical protein
MSSHPKLVTMTTICQKYFYKLKVEQDKRVSYKGLPALEDSKSKYQFLNYCLIEKVTLNKSSLLPKIILQNTQTLQIFTIIFKQKNVYKVVKLAQLEGLGGETC